MVFRVGDDTDPDAGRMVGKMWNLTKVTVKEKSDKKELENLCRVSHPGILLLMAVCQEPDHQDDLGLQLVFQHVPLGSLHHWLHVQVMTNIYLCFIFPLGTLSIPVRMCFIIIFTSI